jgi:hypothetical protein
LPVNRDKLVDAGLAVRASAIGFVTARRPRPESLLVDLRLPIHLCKRRLVTLPSHASSAWTIGR